MVEGGSVVELLLVVGGTDVVVDEMDDEVVGGTEVVVDDGGSEVVVEEGSLVDDGGSVDDGDAESVCEAEVWAPWVWLAESVAEAAGAVGEFTASRLLKRSLSSTTSWTSLMTVPVTAAANR